MSEVLQRVKRLVSGRKYQVSDHAFEEARKDGILPMEIVNGVHNAVVVEDYPDATRGPSVLVLSHGEDMRPIHVVWGIHRETPDKAVAITAYRPDLKRWSPDFLKRIKP